LSDASASALASVSPLAQFTAFRMMVYCDPICAIEPVSVAALDVRWQISREISGLNLASGVCPIIFSVCCTRSSEIKLR
jgi:hypothetical protein